MDNDDNNNQFPIDKVNEFIERSTKDNPTKKTIVIFQFPTITTTVNRPILPVPVLPILPNRPNLSNVKQLNKIYPCVRTCTTIRKEHRVKINKKLAQGKSKVFLF